MPTTSRSTPEPLAAPPSGTLRTRCGRSPVWCCVTSTSTCSPVRTGHRWPRPTSGPHQEPGPQPRPAARWWRRMDRRSRSTARTCTSSATKAHDHVHRPRHRPENRTLTRFASPVHTPATRFRTPLSQRGLRQQSPTSGVAGGVTSTSSPTSARASTASAAIETHTERAHRTTTRKPCTDRFERRRTNQTRPGGNRNASRRQPRSCSTENSTLLPSGSVTTQM